MEDIINRKTDLRLRNASLSLDLPVVMGIVNVTPDSFSDGGRYQSVQHTIDSIGEMLDEGAKIIDIGGESTRPGADPVAVSEEMDRVLPVLETALKSFPNSIFSVDTTKFEVAEASLKLGAHIVNDVSGLRKEPRLAGLCADYDAGYILMHSQGDPQTMQQNPEYKNVVQEIFDFLKAGIEQLQETGVSSVVIDPGIGFGKTLQNNLDIIKGLKKFITLDCPVLVGASRKSMIGELLGSRPADERLAGTLAVHYHCLMQGVNIVRVHDVKEAVDSVTIFEALQDKPRMVRG